MVNVHAYLIKACFVVTMLLLHPQESSQSHGNVLFLIMHGYSRWYGNCKIAQELKAYGYNSSFVVSKGTVKRTADLGIDTIISDGMTKFDDIMDDVQVQLANAGFSGEPLPFSTVKRLFEYCPLVVGDNKLMESLKQRHFDAVIADTIFVEVCMSVIAYKLSIPFIQTGRGFHAHNMRTLIHPSSYPVSFVLPLPLTDTMTYTERIFNTMIYVLLSVAPDPFNPADLVGTFAPGLPHITNEQLRAKTALYLLDTDELIDYHFPTYPNVKYVGGVATRPAIPLKGDIKIFLDSALDGAVLVSFGTSVQSFPNDFVIKLFGVFQKHPKLKFVFRFRNETKIDQNVMLSPWLPQNDVLAHPNIKLFISHCGNNGQYEALYHGVPILGLPVFGDQIYNAARIQAKGFGIFLNVRDFTINDLDAAISELLSNDVYKQNIMKASNIFKSRYFKPAQRAAWWIDHVITFGSQHLHSAVSDLPYYQFLMIDVWAGILTVLFLIGLVSYLILRCVWRTLCKHKDKID